jgi:hypothetical protein
VRRIDLDSALERSPCSRGVSLLAENQTLLKGGIREEFLEIRGVHLRGCLHTGEFFQRRLKAPLPAHHLSKTKARFGTIRTLLNSLPEA